jgi:Peptidase family M23
MEPYCWPLRPFDRAHPVRAYLNDPRISGTSRAFHFGIDISAPDGTAVYAVEAGTVHLEGGRSLSVAAGDGRDFGYWHVVPAVAHRQRVDRHQLLGHIDAPWKHVHFAERWRRSYRNPLRSGALSPWADRVPPQITAIQLFRGRREIPPDRVRGPVDVIAQAFDPPPLPVPRPWHGMPVTPAMLRWRVRRGGRTVRPWRVAVDFRTRMLDRGRFAAVYAPGTRQNHPNQPGCYRFYLAHTWSTHLFPNGPYHLEVEAGDLSGNTVRSSIAIRLANPDAPEV